MRNIIKAIFLLGALILSGCSEKRIDQIVELERSNARLSVEIEKLEEQSLGKDEKIESLVKMLEECSDKLEGTEILRKEGVVLMESMKAENQKLSSRLHSLGIGKDFDFSSDEDFMSSLPFFDEGEVRRLDEDEIILEFQGIFGLYFTKKDSHIDLKMSIGGISVEAANKYNLDENKITHIYVDPVGLGWVKSTLFVEEQPVSEKEFVYFVKNFVTEVSAIIDEK